MAYTKAQMYRCTRHGAFLVIVRRKFSEGALDALEYYQCPVQGCTFVKPSKWSVRMPKRVGRKDSVFTSG